MTYDWTQLGVKEITNLYLYGTPNTPSDLTSDKLIRPAAEITTIDVNMASFMTTGPGRFALGSQSSLVEAFFSSATDLTWAVGNSYTKLEFYNELKNHGVDVGSYFGINLKQVLLGDLSGDYWERAYIWNSEAFKLADNVSFVVDADGTRHIKNYAIVPDSNIPENFDFVGGGRIADFANAFLKEQINPWNIGRVVNINFVDDITQTRDYTYTDYQTDVVKHSDQVVVGAIKLLTLPVGGAAITAQLWDGGVTKTLYQGKALIYGTNDADTLSASQLDNLPLVSPLKAHGDSNGVALIAGGGDDTLNGGIKADYLQGGDGADTLMGSTGDDTLFGGIGDDTYIYHTGDGFDTLLDSDGLGKIQWDGQEIKGANTAGLAPTDWKQLSNTAWRDDTNHITYSLKTQADGSQTLFINKIGDELRIDHWMAGNLGITLGAGAPPSASNLLKGDQHAPITVSNGIPTYQWSATSWAADGTLLGGVAEANFNDVIVGANSDETINGLGGNDALDGGAGNDTLDGGIGDDLIGGGAGSDIIYGGAGNDEILSATGLSAPQRQGPGDVWQVPAGKTLWTQGSTWGIADNGNGTYTIYGGGSLVSDTAADIIFAGSGNDRVTGGLGDDYIDGGLNNDTLWGHGGNDIIDGGDGDDVIQGDGLETSGLYQTLALANQGNDFLDGGAGSDTLVGGGKNDVVLGGIGNDYLWGDTDIVTTQNGQDHGNDFLDGGDGDDQLIGRGKDDMLIGGAGNDLLFGDDAWIDDLATQYLGNDTLDGGDGNDILDGEGGNDILLGGAGIDLLLGGDGNDYLEGGDGDDLSSASGNAAGDGGLDGGGGDDSIYGGAGMDEIAGGDGNDFLDGGTGDDLIFGEAGDDILSGGEGADYLEGGAGNDIYLGVTSLDTVNDHEGNDTLSLQSAGGLATTQALTKVGNSSLAVKLDNGEFVNLSNVFLGSRFTLQFGNNTQLDLETQIGNTLTTAINLQLGNTGGRLFGGAGADTLYGGEGNDTLNGHKGNDIVQGRLGDDTLQGEDGDDQLAGQEGNDILNGGAGNDTLSGGVGDDLYLFGRGDGFDQIGETPNTSGAASTDVLRLGSGVLPEHVTFHRMFSYGGSVLVLVIDGSSTQIMMNGYYTNGDYSIERIEFDAGAGAVWTKADIDAHIQVNTQNNMVGTLADDTYIVDNELDSITESVNGGTDTVIASRSYSLPSNVENLTLTGFLNIDGTGNVLNNILQGNSADNIFIGNGGNDIASGGLGNDTYKGNVTIIESAAEGIDTWVNRDGGVLPDNVENLSLYDGTFSHYIYNVYAYGNALDNILTSGGYGVQGDELDGRGGADTMIIKGNDTPIVYIDNPGDNIIGGVAYEIRSFIDYALSEPLRDGNNQYRPNSVTERLVLEGNNAINGTGNGVNNVLDGSGNLAVNILIGGAGNDSYVLGLNDRVIEVVGEGRDDVQFRGIGAGQEVNIVDLGITNIESFSLVAYGNNAALRGDALDNFLSLNSTETNSGRLFGDGGNDKLYGGSGSDVIDGGAGADLMRGGLGSDLYIVDDLGDQIVEYTDIYSNDQVETSMSFTLPDNVEFLTLTGTAAVNGSGNALWNYLFGNSAANVLDGGAGNDSCNGGGGSDTLIGGDGNDNLNGGQGNDIMIGGLGNDSYYFGTDSGQDTVNNYDTTIGKIDAVQFMSNVAPFQVHVSRLDNDLILAIEGTTATLTLQHYLDNDGISPYAVEQIKFYDGTVWNLDAVKARLNNQAPVLTNALPDLAIVEGVQLSYAIPSATFTDDLDMPYMLTYSATLADGSALPSWLDFSGSSFNGRPVTSSTISVRVTAKDTGNLTVSDVFDIVTHYQNLMVTGTANGDNLYGGTGNDTLSGLGGNDNLYGGEGDDTLNGGAGNDELYGGVGNDTYLVDSVSDFISEYVSGGIDLVQSSITLTLPDDFENLTLIGTAAINGTGNTLDNILTGNSAINTLTGGAGNDRLNGGAGADKMLGGIGNDIYVVDVTTDAITENANEGTDTVETSITYTLGTNVENLTLTGTAAINGTGNTLSNVLIGNSAINTLSGGTGADTLIGGAGNDIYVVDNLLDVVTENSNEGTDLIQSSVAYTLTANVENLILTGTTAINGMGNELDNVLTGNSAVNTLTGGAGNDRVDGKAGADKMLGGLGDDTFVVDISTDAITENAGEGTDTVETGITYTLGANVENLFLTGTTAINGTGNTLNNVLTGNSAVNTLTGGAGNDRLDGKAGADKMLGGTGDDTYIVNISTDAITENANEGTDTVETGITYILGTNIENLLLTGTTAINGTGNALANIIIGNSAANTLKGGAGNDILTGGAGIDHFQLTTALGINNVDTITDFVSGTDKIDLSKAIFTAFNGLTVGSSLNNAEIGNHVLYNASTGFLSYDADGSAGAGAAVQIVLVGTTSHPGSLQGLDFNIAA